MPSTLMNSHFIKSDTLHSHNTSAHPTLTPCIAAKMLSPWKYYHTHKTAIFCKNGAVVPTRTNRTVKPNIPLYSAFLDINTTHSTWLESTCM